MSEDSQKWVVGPGQFLILKPDKYHFATQPCDTITSFFWVHFQSPHVWDERVDDVWVSHKSAFRNTRDIAKNERNADDRRHMKPFKIEVPQFGSINKAALVYERITELISLDKNASNFVRFKQQTLFQLVIMDLHVEPSLAETPSVSNVADMAANFLREHFKEEDLSYEQLANTLNFHPSYISRCMKKIFGCTPNQYLRRYRIDQSKLLLINTEMPIGRIANEVGYSRPSYYSYNFSMEEGETPLEFRHRFKKQ